MKWKIEYRTIELKEKTGEYITAPKKLIQALNDVFNPIAEELCVLVLDSKLQIIEKHIVAKGSINNISTTPADIFRTILINGGNRFILAHNHPSGDISPSSEDLMFTEKIIKASNLLQLDFVDHLIYTDKGYYSFKEEGIL